MHNFDILVCPLCGGKFKYYDRVKRIIKSKNGKKKWIYIFRYRCDDCNSIHRELPNILYSYKHYEAQIINLVINGLIFSDTLGYENYPCETTMLRWKSTDFVF